MIICQTFKIMMKQIRSDTLTLIVEKHALRIDKKISLDLEQLNSFLTSLWLRLCIVGNNE